MKSSDKPRTPTKVEQATGADATKDELYAEAKRRKVTGRSSMTKDELRRALAR